MVEVDVNCPPTVPESGFDVSSVVGLVSESEIVGDGVSSDNDRDGTDALPVISAEESDNVADGVSAVAEELSPNKDPRVWANAASGMLFLPHKSIWQDTDHRLKPFAL
jgi:hypothetical protein